MTNSKVEKFLYYRDLGNDLYLMDGSEMDEFLAFADSLNSSDLWDCSRADHKFYGEFIILAWETKQADKESEE